MKGVSMEDNKKQLAALKRLLERPENRACADCSGGGAASRASWASINTGVFICMRCAGPASTVSAQLHMEPRTCQKVCTSAVRGIMQSCTMSWCQDWEYASVQAGHLATLGDATHISRSLNMRS